MEDEFADSDRPSPRSGAVLMDLLRQAGVGPRSLVRIAGRDGLAPLIWLCRYGFEDVAYVRLGAPAPHVPADLVLALGCMDLAEVGRLLAEPHLLREGGVLVVKTPILGAVDGRDPVHDVLEHAGFHVERCLHRQTRELHVARFEPATGLPRAA